MATDCPPIANPPESKVTALAMPDGWDWTLRERAEQMLLACLAEAGYPNDTWRDAENRLRVCHATPRAVLDKARLLTFQALGVEYQTEEDA